MKVELTEALAFELEGTKPEYQDCIAWLLNQAAAMGAYGDPFGELAVISPVSGSIFAKESDAPHLKR